jgi:citrate lyase subunit beta/citryl-CoA lyase
LTVQANPSPLCLARSLLFVPATRPERFAKALESGADCIIIDLEDAVSRESKDSARDHLARHLPQFSPIQLARTVVRVNAAGTEWHDRDIESLCDWTRQGLTVMLPKSEDACVMGRLGERLGSGARIVALIESLAGLDAADSLAREKHVIRLAFGHLDFQLDLGMRPSPDESELAFARNALVCTSRRSRLPAPIDGVTTDTGSAEQIGRASCRERVLAG